MDINMDYPPTNLDYIHHLPFGNREELRQQSFTELRPDVVEFFLGHEVLDAAFATRQLSPLCLSCDGNVGALTWETSPPVTEKEMMKWMFEPQSIVGYIRNQFSHVLCWCFAPTDLLSSGCILHGWEDQYCPFSPWHLYVSCEPSHIGSYKKAGHKCYPYILRSAMHHIDRFGVIKVEVGQGLADFDCNKIVSLDLLGEAAMISHRVKGVRSIATLEEALQELKLHPVVCNLVYYDGLFTESQQIYTGPNRANTAMLGLHSVIMVAVLLYNGKWLALCKMSNGDRVAFHGYVLVCLSTVYMFVGYDPSKKGKIWNTPKPMHLLSDFFVLDMYDNDVVMHENEKDKDEKDQEKPKESFSKRTLSTAGLGMAGSTSSSVSVESSSPAYVRGQIFITSYDDPSHPSSFGFSGYRMPVPPPVSSSSSVAGPVSISSSVAGMNQCKAICLETAEPKTESIKITRASEAQKHIDFEDVGTDRSLKPLQEVLEGQTDQKESKVLSEKRRFDLSHGKPVDHGDLRMIGSTVNKQIKGELDVFPEEAVILPEAKRIKVSGEVYCDPIRLMGECALNVAALHEKEAEDASEKVYYDPVLLKEVGDASQAEEKEALDQQSG